MQAPRPDRALRAKAPGGKAILKNPEVKAAIKKADDLQSGKTLYVYRPVQGRGLVIELEAPKAGEYLSVASQRGKVIQHRIDGSQVTVRDLSESSDDDDDGWEL